MLEKYSSRNNDLLNDFYKQKLKKAIKYERIAGYFSYSILKIIDEIDILNDNIPEIKIICNSKIQLNDLKGIYSEKIKNKIKIKIIEEWINDRNGIYDTINNNDKFEKFIKYLNENKIHIKVISEEVVGFLHGKTGIFTYSDGSKECFIGSANETYNAYAKNYELIWTSKNIEDIKWVQEEFDFLWNNKMAIDLPDYIKQNLQNIYVEKKIGLKEWKNEKAIDNKIKSALYNTSIFDSYDNLWPHQKQFVELTYKQHLIANGARYVLADSVGLGKTIELASFVFLAGLESDKPILILTPKSLLEQWQNELYEKFNLPSTYRNDKYWILEDGTKVKGEIDNCPRKIAILSQGLIIGDVSKNKEKLLRLEYECVIVDEAHKARRSSKVINRRSKYYTTPEDDPETNNLFKFLVKISSKTKSFILATATPYQLHLTELWDLLYILNKGDNKVLGREKYSDWFKDPRYILDSFVNDFENESTDYLYLLFQEPLLPSDEDPFMIGECRRELKMFETDYVLPEKLEKINEELYKKIIKKLRYEKYLNNHNPFTHRIIRRTREDIEKNNPDFKKITINKINPNPDIKIEMDILLKEIYFEIERFTKTLLERKEIKGSTFLKTIILRRIGSSIYAGYKTIDNITTKKDDIESIIKMLKEELMIEDENFSLNSKENIEKLLTKIEEMKEKHNISDYILKLNEDDIKRLEKIKKYIIKYNNGIEPNMNNLKQIKDPKYEEIKNIINKYTGGFILFSQYFDTAYFTAKKLSYDFPDKEIGLYSTKDKTYIFKNGEEIKITPITLKKYIEEGIIDLIVGTDAASEGLNLQVLSNLINIDLPYNPIKLEQRKGRIYRIGQKNDNINIFNLTYNSSVENRIYEILNERFLNNFLLFGEIPQLINTLYLVEILETKNIKKKNHIIEEMEKHKKERYKLENKIHKNLNETIDWERNEKILNYNEILEHFKKGWD